MGKGLRERKSGEKLQRETKTCRDKIFPVEKDIESMKSEAGVLISDVSHLDIPPWQVYSDWDEILGFCIW